MAFRNIVMLSDHSLNMTGHGHMPKRRVRLNKSNKYFPFIVPLLAALSIVGYSVANEYKTQVDYNKEIQKSNNISLFPVLDRSIDDKPKVI